MFKRKTDSIAQEPKEKRTKTSEVSDSEGEEETGEDCTEQNTSTSSHNNSLLGKLIPNWSWGSPKTTEKGDSSEVKVQNAPVGNSLSPQSPRKASSIITNSKGVVVLVGNLKLSNTWQDELLDMSSDGYKTMAQNVIKLMDDVLHNSNVSKVYMSSVVVKFSNLQNSTRTTRKSPGTICVQTEMTFHHTYTKLFSDIKELCDNVEDFILLQSSLGEIDDGVIQIADGANSVIVEEKNDNNSHTKEEITHGQTGDSFRNDENKGDKFEDAEDSMEENGNTNTSHKSENNEHQHSLENNQTQLESVTSSTQSKIDIFVCTEGENIVVGRTTISDSIGDEPGAGRENRAPAKTTRIIPDKKDQNRNPKGVTKPKKHEEQPSVSGLHPKKATPKAETKQAESESDNDCFLSEPSVLVSVSTTSNTVILKWDRPKKGAKSVDHYEIKYKECRKKKGKWVSVLSEGPEKTVKVKDLKAETEYEFKVRAVNEDGEEGPFCQRSIKLTTMSSLARSLIPITNMIEKGCPKVYKLPLTKDVDTVNENAKTRKCVFGKAPDGRANKEKTIMVIGATGSGKTTLVDGMINYITDVSWEDDFRFSLIDLTEDEKKRKASEAESQTEWITCYTIHRMEGSNIDYTLNIIDTPGFGDTRGIARDKRIVDQIREFFTTPGKQGITCIDAVCFVTQAPLGKLTPPQRYIFDQILSVFGQDIASNIFVLITFADANEPPVRAALKAANVPYQRSYKFNNSALYASPENQAEAEMGNLFWRMGRDNFKVFFDELRSVESKSLLLTSEVLQLRKRLEATIQGLQEQIAMGMNKLNTIKQEKEILKRHKEDIRAKKDFTYEVDEIHMYQIDLEPGVYVTNCMACNRTCHYPCGIPDDIKKENCAAIDQGQCTVCPMHCHWKLHKNNPFRFDTYTMKVTKTYEELKQKYEVAQKEAQKHKCVLGKVKTAFTTLGQDVMTMVHDVRCYINKLNDIALRPNPLSDKDYIDLLIESEKSEKKYGWEQRIKLFMKLRDEAELMEKMHQQNYQPWSYISSGESDDDDEDDDHTTSQGTEDEDLSAGDEAVIDLPLNPSNMEVE